MIDFKLGDTMDMLIGKSDIKTVEGVEAIAQKIKMRIYTVYKEYKYDRRMGLPRQGEGGMFDSSTPLAVRLAMIRRYIYDTPGVLSINAFDALIDDENKGVRIAYEVNTSGGVVSDNLEVS
jgi:hypothetical protein